VSDISLNTDNLAMDRGETQWLNASVSPGDASIRMLSWASSNEAVAMVDQNGRVAAVGVGSATITATAMDGSGVSDSCTVRVYEPIIVNLEMDK
ncbi:Ig-like domain-containing protein, partial [Klebsiella pneumoniae]|uniref:Ig-like domain-containing protein n=1 Tax=Klebsiella pneumoniae TaxID=573 RepID=UPI00117BA488